MVNPELENFLQKLRQLLEPLLAAEYARGDKDAINRIMQAAHNETARDSHDSRESRPRRTAKGRAPHGTVPALIGRVLGECGEKGASASEIYEAVKTAVEKMISYSGVRFALTQGREKGRYRKKNGKWFLRENRATENAA